MMTMYGLWHAMESLMKTLMPLQRSWSTLLAWWHDEGTHTHVMTLGLFSLTHLVDYGWRHGTLMVGSLMKPLWLVTILVLMMKPLMVGKGVWDTLVMKVWVLTLDPTHMLDTNLVPWRSPHVHEDNPIMNVNTKLGTFMHLKQYLHGKEVVNVEEVRRSMTHAMVILLICKQVTSKRCANKYSNEQK